MSHDLLVATRTRPAFAAIEAFAQASGIVLRESSGAPSATNRLVTRVDDGRERVIDIDEPVRIEADDLPDDLVGVVTRPAWLTEIHLPGGYDEATDRWALELAVYLARDGDGAVFDPQLDQIAWPPGVTPRRRGATDERIRTLELDWYIPANRQPRDAADRFLNAVARDFAAAAPTRFGSFEPLQERLDRDGPGAFSEAWQAQADDEVGGMLFWSARSPGLHGSVSFPGRHADASGAVVRLTTSIDARPLYRRPEACEAAVDLFAAVAGDLHVMYAAGCVLRDAIMRRGKVAYDADSELGPLPRNRSWVGLPALPTWLAWFGDPYRDLVESRLDPGTITERPSGLLVRCGREPMDADGLRGVFPDLPAELLATRRPGSSVEPSTRITITSGPPSRPAATIPALD